MNWKNTKNSLSKPQNRRLQMLISTFLVVKIFHTVAGFLHRFSVPATGEAGWTDVGFKVNK
ncbi:MAG: hypothetical protein PUF55_00155 [Bacteroidales bacterium]|nr:hypothetical protein [Bacteroidales bacterium]